MENNFVVAVGNIFMRGYLFGKYFTHLLFNFVGKWKITL
jgi:hypothetical protein